jgi:hypothetical protein
MCEARMQIRQIPYNFLEVTLRALVSLQNQAFAVLLLCGWRLQSSNDGLCQSIYVSNKSITEAQVRLAKEFRASRNTTKATLSNAPRQRHPSAYTGSKLNIQHISLLQAPLPFARRPVFGRVASFVLLAFLALMGRRANPSVFPRSSMAHRDSDDAPPGTISLVRFRTKLAT